MHGIMANYGWAWLMTQIENFHLALLASEAAPGINDLAILLAKAMEHPWVMGKRRPARIVLRNNPQREELIPAHSTRMSGTTGSPKATSS